jgi:pantoate--beta-alanine ligase
MGFLHEGHLSLVRIARSRADAVVVTIFVNPTQFGPAEDFSRYPRDLERDLALCRSEGVDVVFAPAAEAMYAADASTVVDETRLSLGLCGTVRPGHFRGVTTVVAKLFHIIDPDVAVFGEKDAQQAAVIRRMVRDLNMRVEVALGPIVREPDGLAMSSRNAYLTPEQRGRAASIYAALRGVRARFQGGCADAGALVSALRSDLNAAGIRDIDYAVIADPESLAPLGGAVRDGLVLTAVRVGGTRLIDNLRLTAR